MTRGLPSLLACLVVLFTTGCGGGGSSGGGATLDDEFQALLMDAGVEPIAAPAPFDVALVSLGRNLFFDKIISGPKNISCATCHHPSASTGDALPCSIGSGGVGLGENRSLGTAQMIPRNAPPIFNTGLAGHDSAFWDSRVARDPTTGQLMVPWPGLNGPTPTLAVEASLLTTAVMAQAMFPPTSPPEMRGPPDVNNPVTDPTLTMAEVWPMLIDRLVGVEGVAPDAVAAAYRPLFAAAYPAVGDAWDDYTFAHAARAIGAYEIEAFTKIDTPFDQYLIGDTSALSDAEKRGGVVFFGAGGCATCHNGPLLSDFEHHVIAVPQVGPGRSAMGGPNESPDDRGRALITGDASDSWAFRTPPLRNVALTGPWMHDGAFPTLEAVIEHYDDATVSVQTYDPVQNLPLQFQLTWDDDPTRESARLAALDSDVLILGLTDAQKADLLSFLNALTDPSAVDLQAEVPSEVPSGLPVTD